MVIVQPKPKMAAGNMHHGTTSILNPATEGSRCANDRHCANKPSSGWPGGKEGGYRAHQVGKKISFTGTVGLEMNWGF